ncbi:MAG TPA: EboA domain-containing protein [Vicinamibacterales bacterium]|nr:EboA domain-containing protein [Vicinamibacterales bacterium]
MPSTSVTLSAVTRARLSAAAATWFDNAIDAARRQDRNRLLGSYTGAARHAGNSSLSLTAEERSSLLDTAPEMSFDHWTNADAARAALLLAAAEGAPDVDAWIDLATACFENGDAREQQSWLRGLALMPHAQRFTSTAVDSCRSHIQPTFESIACENPFPAACFPENQFNQMVLKALFTGVRIERITGLTRRLNPELSRMARDYAAERRAAGRPVPVDLPLALHDLALEEHTT